jgi:hypothetical protein
VPEVEFTVDAATGRLEFHVKGIAGPSCDDVARLAKELLGEPSLERNTGEYYLRPHVKTQARTGTPGGFSQPGRPGRPRD